MKIKKNRTDKILAKIYNLKTKKTDKNKLFIEQFYIIKEMHNNTIKNKIKK